MKRYITLKGRLVCYDLQRKRVKNINLRIKPDLSVNVSANGSVPLGIIEDLLQSKSDFILNALDKYTQMSRNAPKPKEYINGELFYFCGREMCLRVCQGSKNSVESDEDFLTLTVKSPDDTEMKKKTLDEWYKDKSREIITEICKKIYPEFQSYGINFPILKFRTMTSRWGSCQPSSGILTFNTELVKKPIECIEYVVAHEFTHFLQPNHSDRFYEQLALVMPDWKARREKLNS